MSLVYKEIAAMGRSMYLYYPKGGNRTAFKRSSITILRDEADEASVQRLLGQGLAALAEQDGLILSFPNPPQGGWECDPALDAKIAETFNAFQDAMSKPDDKPLALRADGIPTYEAMMSTWHPMNDTKYLIGIGKGASLACTLAACAPQNIAAVLAIGGNLCEGARKQAVYAPMPISLVGTCALTCAYFVRANAAHLVDESGARTIYKNQVNPLQCVVYQQADEGFSQSLLEKVWDKMFRTVRRPNTGRYGDCEPRMDFEAAGFEVFLDDERLEEAVKTPHTWLTHVPQAVRAGEKKAPLLLFFHGGSDNPAEAAEMSKFHELGEQEGFITVYPWGTNKTQWNSDMNKDEADDVGFAVALIQYMCQNYPVDPQRVYLSGFSNGAAHAQAVALTHPRLIAAICHIDSNWPGSRNGPSEVDYNKVRPYRLAMELKKEYDYRIPVWYTYGSRELSYPVYKGCSQQHQYDFWKRYNNIEVRETPGRENPHPCGCGVLGDRYEVLAPSARHPHHEYDVQHFYSMDDEPQNLYNYVLMRDKGHDIAQMDPALGWNYVKQFRRLADGSLGRVEETK